jgi:hypothetical protein
MVLLKKNPQWSFKKMERKFVMGLRANQRFCRGNLFWDPNWLTQEIPLKTTQCELKGID